MSAQTSSLRKKGPSLGPIKSERNKAAAASSSSSRGTNSQASSSSAFHKSRSSKPDKSLRSFQAQSGPTSSRSKSSSAVVEAQKDNIGENHESEKNSSEEEDDDDVRSKTSLSLSGHPLPPLSALVETLSQFRYLQRLDLSSLQSSDSNPEGLTRIEWLAKAVFRSQKANQKGKSKQTTFGDRLTWLNLSQNEKLSQEGCLGLEALEELVLLNISHCALTKLPVSITPLKNLKALVLNNNDIQSLPQAFPYLPELNSLILSHNKLTQIPASLPSSLPALKKLSLGHNQLKGAESLPDFSGCLSLREVRLNDNPQLVQLPSHINTWGKGVDGRTAPGLELLELKDCGLQDWESLATLVTLPDPKESQPHNRKGLTQLLLKGNGVAASADYKERILHAHPTLRVLDSERLQPKVKPAPTTDESIQASSENGLPHSKQSRKQAHEDTDARIRARAERAMAEAEAEDEDQDNRFDVASEAEESEDDDEEAAQMAAEMRALRRGQDRPSSGKEFGKTARTDKQRLKSLQNGGEHYSETKAKTRRGGQSGKKDRKTASSEASEVGSNKGGKNASKSKKDLDTGSGGKKGKLNSRTTTDAEDEKKAMSKAWTGFEAVDEESEKARLASVHETVKQQAKISSGREQVSEGVLEDVEEERNQANAARKKKSKTRKSEQLVLGLAEDVEDENDQGGKSDVNPNAPVPNSKRSLRKARKQVEQQQQHEAAKEPTSSAEPNSGQADRKESFHTPTHAKEQDTSVAAIVDLRKRDANSSKNLKRKKSGTVADQSVDDASSSPASATKKSKIALPFLAANKKQNDHMFGSGADTWGGGAGAWD